MDLWHQWLRCALNLRPAFSRFRTFMWFLVAMMAMTVRSDLAGVTSFIRSHWLIGSCYDGLRRLFHSTSVDLATLTTLWVKLCLNIFVKHLFCINGRLVLVADGIKVPKEGKKMPGVKRLHQESESNSKPEWIMGHSCQVVSLIVSAVGHFCAVPLASRIHEGVKFTNRDKRTLLDKLIALIYELRVDRGFYLLVDAYYASKKMALPLIEKGDHIICRIRTNAVAYEPAPTHGEGKKNRGRPKMYGKKFALRDLFKNLSAFEKAMSPVYDEEDVELFYRTVDLIWRPIGRIVRFVLVEHPTRGKMILMTTDLNLDPMALIHLYGLRFKIEVSFRQAVDTTGTYCYRFWMKMMVPTTQWSGNQFLHRTSEKYRGDTRKKLRAYTLHIQMGVIVQGLLQYLSVTQKKLVWNNFGSWMRTMNSSVSPSEKVVAQAMKSALPHFLLSLPATHILQIFLFDKLDVSRCPEIRLAA